MQLTKKKDSRVVDKARGSWVLGQDLAQQCFLKFWRKKEESETGRDGSYPISLINKKSTLRYLVPE